MTTFRKRPIEIEAKQFTGDNYDEIKEFVGNHTIIDTPAFRHGSVDGGVKNELWVAANNSWLPIETGEWVIKDSLGFYPCKEDKFAETYDEVDERVRMGYPVRVLGDQGEDEVLNGICRIFGNGEMSIELTQEDAELLVETVSKNILTEMAINYRSPDNDEVTVDLTFEKELGSLINRYSLDNYSGTPDFILASFLGNVLTDWNHAIGARAKWRGESNELPALQGTHSRIKLREVLHRNGYLPNDIQHVIDDIHEAGIVLREGVS